MCKLSWIRKHSPIDHSRSLSVTSSIIDIMCWCDSTALITRSAQRHALHRILLTVCHNEFKSQPKSCPTYHQSVKNVLFDLVAHHREYLQSRFKKCSTREQVSYIGNTAVELISGFAVSPILESTYCKLHAQIRLRVWSRVRKLVRSGTKLTFTTPHGIKFEC